MTDTPEHIRRDIEVTREELSRDVDALSEKVSPARVLERRVDKAKDVVHAVEHPVETVKALEHEAAEGKSARTPLIAVTGIALILGVIFVILLAIILTLYFVYGGK